jgi:2-methylisocitrate lyase-like PEP mutase family enzyme
VNGHRMNLRGILSAQTKCLPVPGCWDGLSARLIEQAGFPVAFLSGGAHSMGRFGLPDMGFVSLAELAETTRIITDCTNIALIVDADTGFGNALNTAQTMRMLERAGASAIQLEDQTSPKRCGHMSGKSVIPPQLAAGKIMAAVDARMSTETLVIGRTDAASLEGIEAAIARAHLYLEAGADLIFIEGPNTISDMKLIQASFGGRIPLVHNMVGGGTNPITTPEELDATGIAIALHPLMLLANFASSATLALEELYKSKTASDQMGAMTELEAMNKLVDTKALMVKANNYA